MRNLMLICLLFLFSAGLTYADVIKAGSFQANSDGVNVTLYWITEDESNIARFEIQRRSGFEGDFTTIATVDPKGSSLYEFVDHSAFRKITTIYQYRIKVVFSNGTNPVYAGPLTVSHTVSGVRRTWGSIKAMFR